MESPERARRRAEELAQAGMPFQMAMAVAHGRLTMNEALERMDRQQKVQVLMDKHELSRALATQIALGQASLERVLATRRFADHREQNRDRSVLVEYEKSGATIVLGLHGNLRATGQIVEVRPYDILFRDDGQEATREIHKLQIKYAYAPDAWKRVRKNQKTDKDIASKDLTPQERPQDRYGCSDKRLFRYLDKKTEIRVTLIGGEQFRGVVTWFGRYEFGLDVRDADVTIFRHALQDIAE